MPAILGILKVIGILLLVLLGILLLLIIILLFCPIFYKVAGAKKAGTENFVTEGADTEGVGEFSLQVSARWLLGLLGIKYCYPQPGAVKVKLLCFTLYDSSKNPKETPAVEETASTPKASAKAQGTGATVTGEATFADTASTDSSTSAANTDKEVDTAATGTENGSSQESVKTKQSLPEKLKSLYKEFCFYRDFWNATETRELLKNVIFRCKKIVFSILPKKLEAQLLIGTGQPDTTGYVMAVYGMLLPYLGDKVRITADFEDQILEGQFKAKGHICIFTLLRHTLSVLLDKNLRIVYKRFKKHKAKVVAAQTVATDATSNSGK